MGDVVVQGLQVGVCWAECGVCVPAGVCVCVLVGWCVGVVPPVCRQAHLLSVSEGLYRRSAD